MADRNISNCHRNKYLQSSPWLLLLVCSCLLSVQQGASAVSTPVQARAAAAQAARQALNSMLRVPLAASPSILEQGYGAVQGARNWDTIAQKLSKQGANIQVAVFGSSLTQGYHKGSGFAETWAHEVQRWLQAAFPSSNVDLINLARDATDVTPAATCWYQRVPADADLVIVDYSLGGCGNMLCAGVGSELVASYETLLRRLMRNAPNAALLLLENFFFLDMAGPGQPATPLPYYQTGGDMHWLLARRYRIPMVSVRDALYDVMFNDTALQAAVGVTRQQMMADAMHPTAQGHRIIGRGLVAYALRATLQQELSGIITAASTAPSSTSAQPHSISNLNSTSAQPQPDVSSTSDRAQLSLNSASTQPPSINLKASSTSAAPQLNLSSASPPASKAPASTSAPTASSTSAPALVAVHSPSTSASSSISAPTTASAASSTSGATATSTSATARVAAQQQLPDAVSPLAAHEADGDPFCADGRDLDAAAIQSTVQSGGWQWSDSAPGTAADIDACRAARAARGAHVNCGNWGLSTKGVGKRLEFVVDTQSLQSSSSSSSSLLDRRRLVVFYDRAMAKGFRVGGSSEPPTALVQCVRGCSCSELLLGGQSLTWSELMASGSTEVSQHLKCVVRLTIVDRGADTNDFFKVNGIAVVPFRKPRVENWFAEVALAREQMFMDEYKSRLVPHLQLDAVSATDAAWASDRNLAT